MKRLLVIAAGLCAVLLLSAGAYFTDRVEVPESMIRAASVDISAEPTRAALSIDGLAPGLTATRTVNVLNEGDLPVDVVMTCAKKAGITAFWNSLTCRVSCDGGVLYDGLLAEMRTEPMPMQACSTAPVRFAVSMPATATNDMAGDYVKVSVYFDAEQAHP